MGSRLKGEKSLFASSFFKFILLFIILTIIISSLFFKIIIKQELIISGQNNSTIYYTFDVSPEDKVTFGWIHSFEHIPWTEEYYIKDNNHLLLDTFTIAGFGAGIPHNKGVHTKIENGIIFYEDINQDFEYIEWIHSQTALEYIKLNDKVIIKGEDLNHHEFIKLKVEKRVELWRR